MGVGQVERWVALFRGINIGGHNKVPMADLRALCGDLGWADAKTYIASGNLVFSASGTPADLAATLRGTLRDRRGVDVAILVLSGDEVRSTLAACPFDPEVPKFLHAFFCWTDPVIVQSEFDRHAAPSEQIDVCGRTVWLHTPQGFGTSKLAEKIGKVITGTETTARNLNTVRTLVEMLD